MKLSPEVKVSYQSVPSLFSVIEIQEAQQEEERKEQEGSKKKKEERKTLASLEECSMSCWRK